MAALVSYRNAEGHVRVPRSYACPDGFRLGVWVHNIRSKHRRGGISPERVAALDALGFQWKVVDRDAQRTQAISALRLYQAKHDCLPPADYVTRDGFALGAWLAGLRYRARTSPTASTLLRGLGLDHSLRDSEQQWATGLRELRRYVETFGDTRVPAWWRTPSGFPLGRWVDSRRADSVAGRLLPFRRAALDAVHFEYVLRLTSPSPARQSREDAHVQARLSELAAYRAEHGHTRIPVRYISPQGTALGRWALRQRIERSADRLSTVRVQALKNLGFL